MAEFMVNTTLTITAGTRKEAEEKAGTFLEETTDFQSEDGVIATAIRPGSDDETLRALAQLYDAVQRGDFDIVGVAASPEAQAAIALLKKNGATFNEYNRRSGAIDKHGNMTP